MAPKVTKSKPPTNPSVGKKEDNAKDKKERKNVLQVPTQDATHYPSKLHILCLHGFRTSGKIMAEQVTLANWSSFIDDIAKLVFMDGPWPASGNSDVEKIFAGPYYEWYQANEDYTEVYGLKEATTLISSFIARHGPFDGIMGFSQGAILSAALVGLYEKGMGPQIPNINFLILVGGGRSKAKTLRPAYFDTIMCSSLHMIGDKDYMKESGESLLEAFLDPTVIRHPSGHVVPKLDAKEGNIFRDFLVKQLQLKLSPSPDEIDIREANTSYFEDQIATS